MTFVTSDQGAIYIDRENRCDASSSYILYSNAGEISGKDVV